MNWLWILFAVVGLLLFILAIVFLPPPVIQIRLKRISPRPPIKAEDLLAAENDVRSSLLQLVTAIILIIGAAYSAKQIINTVDATQKQNEATREQLALAARGQVSERFTRAVDELGNEASPTERLGGIYALGTIGYEAPTYRTEVIDVLSAYIRSHAGSPTPPTETRSLESRKPDVQAALTVLTAQSRAARGSVAMPVRLSPSLDLAGADLKRAVLAGVDLTYDALDYADLSGSDIRGACLVATSLTGAHLEGADLRGADLRQTEGLWKAHTDAKTTWDSTTHWPSGFYPLSGRSGSPRGTGRPTPPLSCPATAPIKITNPVDGATVAPFITAQGQARSVPAGDEIWIVIFTPFHPRYYPQGDFPSGAGPTSLRNGTWESPGFYVGVKKDKGLPFDILAVQVDKEAQQVFWNYLKISNKRRSFGGWPKLPNGAVAKAEVRVVRG